jgi:DNA mismatch endonuclease (patch repair protein)
MTDIFTQEKRSEIMSRIKGKNTKPELALFELVKPLWQVCRYRKHHNSLPGRPDLVFPRAKLAVFVDGAFWHGKDYAEKSANWSSMWKKKIEGNMLRDQRVNEELQSKGYTVLRFWDNEVLKDSENVLSKIESELKPIANKEMEGAHKSPASLKE